LTDLEAITKRVLRNGHPDDPNTPMPLLTLEEFFTGNSVVGSICCNLDPCPDPQQVFEALKRIRQRDGVADVRIQISAFDDPDWPFSDTVWVITCADSAEVSAWLPSELAPDECWEGWIESYSYEECEVPDGMQPIAVWWD